MSKISYEQAYSDWEYLFNTIGCAYDMTGGYVDQEDLAMLLKSPTKKTACWCLVRQIKYWFQSGLDEKGKDSYEFCHLITGYYRNSVKPLILVDSRVAEIVERYNIDVRFIA